MGLKYEIKHKDRSMLKITPELYNDIKDLAKQLNVTIVDATRRIIGVGFNLELKNEPKFRPFVRETQNQYDKRKKYEFIKVTRNIQMAVRMYSLWLNITVTEAACRIITTRLKRYKGNDTSDDYLKVKREIPLHRVSKTLLLVSCISRSESIMNGCPLFSSTVPWS